VSVSFSDGYAPSGRRMFLLDLDAAQRTRPDVGIGLPRLSAKKREVCPDLE